MTTIRKEKTLADYLVIAVAPLLIMALVGSVAFFLLEIGYHGQWAGRMRWTMFWFVLATVLISRIAIEQGSTYARVYGIALALAVVALLHRLGGATVVVWGLLAFIWWCTGRLTWDCTLVDDDEDASGEGLLHVAGLDQSAGESAEGRTDSEKRLGWWERWKQIMGRREGRPHAPGSWVIYFSLLALPAFGIGQAFFPTSDSAGRDYGFKLLSIYVAAALGLLLATSFLGLRRYLRQRNLQMPIPIAGIWMLLGSLLAGAIMVACLLLPRPDGLKTLTAMVDRAAEAHQQASRQAILAGEAATGEGRRIGDGSGETTEKNGAEDQKQGGGQADGKKKSGEKGKSAQPGDGSQASKDGKSGKKGQPGGGAKSGEQKQSPTPTGKEPQHAGDWMKWILYAIVLLVILYVVYRHRREVLAFLRELWATLRQMLASLLGWKRKEAEPEGQGAVTEGSVAPKPFASFNNPFGAGITNAMTPEELVNYTFAALEAWAAERGMARAPHETPMEFAKGLMDREPGVGGESRSVALLYSRVAYAGLRPTPENLECLERLWTAMEMAPAEPLVTA